MSITQKIIEDTKNAAADAFKYAKAVPADKVDWKPLDAGRSVLEMCKELAMCPTWSTMIASGQELPPMNEESMAEFAKMTSGWTVEDCEKTCMKNLEDFYKVAAEFPESRLGEKYTLPFDGGQEITQRQNLEYPLWNLIYHQGQIGYIQTLYGDRNMYW